MGELLKEKIAIVTGAAKGNGFGIACGMVEEGAIVFLWDILDDVRESAKRIDASGRSAIGLKVEITDPSEVENAVGKVIDGFQRVDILVNNAGIYPSAPFLEIPDEIRDKCWDINMKGAWNCTKAVLPNMIRQRNGKIINVSSITGPIVSAPGFTAYAMSKGAVSAMTKSLAIELARFGINVNAILPGAIDTPGLRAVASEADQDPENKLEKLGKGIPWGRVGTINEVAGPAIFLASKYSNYITGAEIVVDGGNTLQELKSDIS